MIADDPKVLHAVRTPHCKVSHGLTGSGPKTETDRSPSKPHDTPFQSLHPAKDETGVEHCHPEKPKVSVALKAQRFALSRPRRRGG